MMHCHYYWSRAVIRSALVAALLGGGGLAAYAEGPGKKIHSPPEMMKLIEASTLAYTLSVLKEPVSSKIDGAVVGDDLFLKTEKGRRTLARYSLSRGASTQLEKAEHAFRERRWDEAMRLYEAVRQSSPDYGHVLVLIGDVHY